MIISASRRTDIPAFYAKWFEKRIKDGYVLVQNPFNLHQASKISLRREDVDLFVFWTKNPIPFMSKLIMLDDLGYKYYFQFTLNSYAKDIEQNVLSKSEKLIDAFIALSEQIGKEKVIWRYDPILINDKYTFDYHYKYFDMLCSKLHSYTNLCVISFIDLYDKTKRNIKGLNILSFEENTSYVYDIASNISNIANTYNLKVKSCSEKYDLQKYGIEHNSCIDKLLVEKIIGYSLDIKKDKNQRAECGCVQSIDIGVYNTCNHGCTYCYANYSKDKVKKIVANFNNDNEGLGDLTLVNKIIDKTINKNKKTQMSLKQTDLFTNIEFKSS